MHARTHIRTTCRRAGIVLWLVPGCLTSRLFKRWPCWRRHQAGIDCQRDSCASSCTLPTVFLSETEHPGGLGPFLIRNSPPWPGHSGWSQRKERGRSCAVITERQRNVPHKPLSPQTRALSAFATYVESGREVPGHRGQRSVRAVAKRLVLN